MKRLLLSIVLLLTVANSYAANCGGVTVCNCGDTITSDYTLPADLACSGDGNHGLVVGKGTPSTPIVIDGGGHTLSGDYGDQAYGLYFQRSAFATVQNLRVTKFNVGVRFRNAHQVTLKDSFIFDNGRGTRVVTGSNNYNVEFTSPTDTASSCVDYAGNALAQCCPSGATTPCLYGVTLENNQIYATTTVIASTTLANAAAVGDLSVTVTNATGLTRNQRVVLNDITSELLTIASVAGSIVTFTTTLLNGHSAGVSVAAYIPALTPDESVHIGSGQKSGDYASTGGDCVTPDANYPDIVVKGNTIKDSDNENLYPFGTRCLTIENNTLTRTPIAGTSTYLTGTFTGLYIKDAHHLTVTGNTVSRSVLHVTGDAHDNLFTNNILTDNGWFFDKYPSEAKPTNNVVVGGSVNAPTGNCLRVEKCSGNSLRNVEFQQCGDEVVADDFGTADTTHVVLYSPQLFTGANWAVRNGATVDVAITYNETVTNQNQVPLNAATVTMTKADTTQAFSVSTGADGKIPQQDVLLYRQSASGRTDYGPFTITTSKAAHDTDTKVGVTLVIDTAYVVILFDPSQQYVFIESPVDIPPGSTQQYYGIVRLRGGGQLRSSATVEPMGFTVNVQGDFILEAGAQRMIANRAGYGGDLSIVVTGDCTIRGDVSSAAIATGRTNGGNLTLRCATILVDRTTIKTDGGRDLGKAGNIRLEATETLTLTQALLSAVGASGGAITVHGSHLILGGTMRAIGKAPQYVGSIRGEYAHDVVMGDLVATPTIQLLQP